MAQHPAREQTRVHPESPDTMLVVDGQPHLVGGRLGKLMRFLLANARDVNREDLAELTFRVNEIANPHCVDPYWAFRGERIR